MLNIAKHKVNYIMRFIVGVYYVTFKIQITCMYLSRITAQSQLRCKDNKIRMILLNNIKLFICNNNAIIT